MTEPVTYPIICAHCPAHLVADGDDLACPNGHEKSRLLGALKPLQPQADTTLGFICAWDGRRNLAGGAS